MTNRYVRVYDYAEGAKSMMVHDRLPGPVRRFITTMAIPPSPEEIVYIMNSFDDNEAVIDFLKQYDHQTRVGYRDLMLHCMDDFGK